MTSTDHSTEAAAGRRSGGRAGRQALRASHVVEAETYLTRTMKPFEIVSDPPTASAKSAPSRPASCW